MPDLVYSKLSWFFHIHNPCEIFHKTTTAFAFNSSFTKRTKYFEVTK